MNLLIIVGLVLAGLILLLVEVFLVPGISIAGLGAVGCIFYAIYHAFSSMGMLVGILTLIASLIASVLIFIWFMRSKSLDRLALKKDIDSSVKEKATENIKEGDKGTALTRLALIGNADFNGNIVEVKSAGDFINEHTPIVVKRISNHVIIVEPSIED